MAKVVKKKAAKKAAVKKTAVKKPEEKKVTYGGNVIRNVLKNQDVYDLGLKQFRLFRLFGKKKRYIKRHAQDVGYVFTRDLPAAFVFKNGNPDEVANAIGNVKIEMI